MTTGEALTCRVNYWRLPTDMASKPTVTNSIMTMAAKRLRDNLPSSPILLLLGCLWLLKRSEKRHSCTVHTCQPVPEQVHVASALDGLLVDHDSQTRFRIFFREKKAHVLRLERETL